MIKINKFSGSRGIFKLEQILDKDPKYIPFTWKEYIQGRVDDNYTDLGEEDIQISRFRA